MTLRTLNYGNYGIFLIMGSAGICPSAVGPFGYEPYALGFCPSVSGPQGMGTWASDLKGVVFCFGARGALQ